MPTFAMALSLENWHLVNPSRQTVVASRSSNGGLSAVSHWSSRWHKTSRRGAVAYWCVFCGACCRELHIGNGNACRKISFVLRLCLLSCRGVACVIRSGLGNLWNLYDCSFVRSSGRGAWKFNVVLQNSVTETELKSAEQWSYLRESAIKVECYEWFTIRK